ncbi:choline dehydrogenase [Strigomonas culicis]|uniref:Choline dehydrogenase n=1 Tax=Strigomonas culicis TaxID=28005 RepID=S9WAZ1_9TRYP|nr:choline dehydrogenase [Strigomonas culicis]|eukprot:EPY36281.1 choline dehydrogenase [Strigomonas culicis]
MRSARLLRAAAGAPDVASLPFDAVVVGSGTAGCLIAGRLAMENIKTLLVESGPDVRKKPEWHRTLPSAMIAHRIARQGYESADTITTPQQLPNGEKAEMRIPTPHVLGGHGVVGSKTWNLGDADDWKGTPWDFRETLLPKIRAMESMQTFVPHRGKRGKFVISRPSNFTPYFKPYCEAISLDVPMLSEFTKPSFKIAAGCGRPDLFADLDTGKAHSTLQRYVMDVAGLQRPLRVACGAQAIGIRAGDGKDSASGVTIKRADGQLADIQASMVIVSAGTIGSARLLASSRGAIAVDRSVGTNLWDKPQLVLQYATKDRLSSNCYFDPLVRAFVHMDLRRGRPLSDLCSSYDDLVTYWSSTPGSPPEAEILFQPFTLNNDGTNPIPGEHGAQFVIRPLRPRSRGVVTADGKIDPRYFSHSADAEVLQKAAAFVQTRLVKSTPFVPVIGKLVGERFESSGVNGGTTFSSIDPVTFQLKEVSNVFVCDGSVIPQPVSGSVLPYTLALADLFADKLLHKKEVRRKVQESDDGGSTRIVY